MATTTETVTKKLHAKYWRYTGNHHAGKDCERYDPHGFGLKLISFAAYLMEQEKEVEGVRTVNNCKLSYSNGDDFGYEVKVAATPQLWAACRLAWWKALAEDGKQIPLDQITTEENASWVDIFASVDVPYCDRIQEESGQVWAMAGDEVLQELFYKTDDQTRLEMFQQGYYPVNQIDSKGNTLWMEVK